MKVEITSCSKPGMWYKNKIGEVFDVQKPGLNNDVSVLRNHVFRILGGDYRILDDNVPDKENPVNSYRKSIAVYSNKQFNQ